MSSSNEGARYLTRKHGHLRSYFAKPDQHLEALRSVAPKKRTLGEISILPGTVTVIAGIVTRRGLYLSHIKKKLNQITQAQILRRFTMKSVVK